MLGLKMRSVNRGFTLIELMIVVAIIGILAAIAIPKFADLIRKSNEGASKGNLASIRSALAIYYGDTEGWYPIVDPSGSLTGSAKYLKDMPSAHEPPYHGKAVTVSVYANQLVGGDAAGWAYASDRNQKDWGTLWVNCSHTDTRSVTWSSY